MKIRSIKALEILDSRGCPTVETTVNLEDGSSGSAIAPSGASTGSHEAKELRDNDSQRYQGLGVLQAVANMEKIAAALLGQEADNQSAIDKIMIELDGTENKSKLGANAILSVSLAVAVAQAQAERKALFRYLSKFNPEQTGKYLMPIPAMNVINGGRHANWATDIQEYQILPVGAKTIEEAIRMGAEVYASLKQLLRDKGYDSAVGDEGGFAPQVKSNEEPLELIAEAVINSGHSLGQDIVLGIDAAASEFFVDGHYHLKKENKKLDSQELAEYYQKLMGKYPLISLEDVFAEDDWAGFTDFSKTLKANAQVVADDLCATNLARLEKIIETRAAKTILIKPNQIGTLSETIAVILKAKQNGLACMISHRSGESEDTFISDLAVAMGVGQIKAGAPARGERTAKYNRLLRIADKMESGAEYAAWPWK